jgi:arylformamidase
VVDEGAVRSARDLAYSPGRFVDVDSYVRTYAARSAHSRSMLDWQELAYGRSPPERLHLFPPTTSGSAPLHVFLHGGYWQQLGVTESSFAAVDVVAGGAAFAALGYGLAPAHTLDEIVAMVRRGVLWLFEHAEQLGVDPARIFLSGMSAGAHLAAMCLLDDWLPAGLGVREVVCGAALLSGIYDLEPLRATYVGEAIALTEAQAQTNSPVRHLHPAVPPLIVARGTDETSGFVGQQQAFVEGATARGIAVHELVVKNRNHFDLPFDLGDRSTALGAAVRRAM